MTANSNTATRTTASPGKTPLTERQLGAMFSSSDYEETLKGSPKNSADYSLLYTSMDSLASAGTADFWKSKDLAVLFASSDSVKMPPLAASAAEAGERFRSIDAAVGLMAATNPTVPQTLMATLMSKDSIFASKDSVFASIDPLPFGSLDSVMSGVNDGKMPDVPPTFALPGIYESREWLNLYEESHKEIPYTQEVFRTSEAKSRTAKRSKWEDAYREALKIPAVITPAITPTPPAPAPKPTPKKTSPKKKSSRGEPKEKIYVEPTHLDIISGRGGKSNSWPGNEGYRAAIEEAKPTYRDGAKYEKTIMSRQIVEEMMSEGRRFLKLDDAAGPHRGEYYLMTKNQARKKAGQALREENTPESRKKKREFYANKNKRKA